MAISPIQTSSIHRSRTVWKFAHDADLLENRVEFLRKGKDTSRSTAFLQRIFRLIFNKIADVAFLSMFG